MTGRRPSLLNAFDTVIQHLYQRLAEVREERAQYAAELATLDKELEHLLMQDFVERWTASMEELDEPN